MTGSVLPFGLGLFSMQTIYKAVGIVVITLIAAGIGCSAGYQKAQKLDDTKFAPICEAVGSTWVQVDSKGKPTGRDTWGRACLASALDLSKFKTQAILASNKVVSDFNNDQIRRTENDGDAAAQQALARSKAIQNMEKTNGKVSKDQVGADWFDGLNAVGGLRAPNAAPARRRGAKAGATAAPSVDDVR